MHHHLDGGQGRKVVPPIHLDISSPETRKGGLPAEHPSHPLRVGLPDRGESQAKSLSCNEMRTEDLPGLNSKRATLSGRPEKRSLHQTKDLPSPSSTETQEEELQDRRQSQYLHPFQSSK